MSNHVSLTAEAHRDLRVRTDCGADLGDAVMHCLTVPDEFRRVQNEYPILFRYDAVRDSYAAFAIFGFAAGENLFLQGDRWDARYRPLAIDIQPFLIGRAAPDAPGSQVHVDMASARLTTGEGIRVFDEDGAPTPYLERVAAQLGELEVGLRGADAFYAALRRHELLEPLSVDVTLADGSTNRLVGYHAIDEDRLRALDGAAMAELHDAGHLMPLFMALASLSNFDALVARKNRRMAHG
ncbi:SapC family protein [Sphingomonas sp. RS6]